MARLIYSMLMSLDGYIADEDGNFDWAFPGEEVHRFINDQMHPVGIHMYGRRLYEIMVAWESMGTDADSPEEIIDFAKLWRSAEKVVYSRTLQDVSSARTRIEREFNPESVRELKTTTKSDIVIGGPDLAHSAFRHRLIDECHLYLSPVIVGAGKRGLPAGIRVDLHLLEQKRFDNGMVYLRYNVQDST